MNKEFYRNNENGTHWQIYSRNLYGMPARNKIRRKEFYLFPTLKFDYTANDIFRTNTFDIKLIWLFWEIRIAKYWGEAYKEEMELLNQRA